MPSNKAIIAGVFSFFSIGVLSAPAHAVWRFHPEHCPALEAHRAAPDAFGPEGPGAPVAVCPTVAWAWHGEPHLRTPPPGPAAIHYHHGDRYYYRHGPHGEPIRVFLP